MLQMNTIHGRLDGHFFPCVYILMQTKDKEAIQIIEGIKPNDPKCDEF